MPAALASKEEIIDRLFTVFRDRGFEGASIADLSRATGLGKSSLYHYFPKGKEQMAEAVLNRAHTFVDSSILEVAQSSEPLQVRTRKIVATLEHIYAGGRTQCVLGQLAASEIGTDARHHLQEAYSHWVTGLAKLAADSGMTSARARAFAEDWVAGLQGALILQAATGNQGPFERSMGALLELGKARPERAKP